MGLRSIALGALLLSLSMGGMAQRGCSPCADPCGVKLHGYSGYAAGQLVGSRAVVKAPARAAGRVAAKRGVTAAGKNFVFGKPYDFDFLRDRTQLLIDGGPGGLNTSDESFQRIIGDAMINNYDLFVEYDDARNIVNIMLDSPTTYPTLSDRGECKVLNYACTGETTYAYLDCGSGPYTYTAKGTNACHVLRVAYTTGELLQYVDFGPGSTFTRCKVNRPIR
jgi:hypothetical protein